MSAAPNGPLLGFVNRFAAELRFPQLFWMTAILFLADLLVPDLIPFVDEILLALATLLFGSWKRRRRPPPEPSGPKHDGPIVEVTPE